MCVLMREVSEDNTLQKGQNPRSISCIEHGQNVQYDGLTCLCVCVCVSGLLHPGDLLVEVNGSPVVGLEPEQVIQILVGHF